MSQTPQFSAMILTATPPGLVGEGNGSLVKIDGREAILRSVELFLNRANITQVLLVISQEAEEEVKRKVGGALGFLGAKVAVGGKKWQEQLAAAAAKLAAGSTHVLVHDACRPGTPFGDIDAVLEAAAGHAAVTLAAPIRTALVEVDEGQNAMALHASSAFLQLLSPQVYSRQRFTELAAGRDVHPTEFKLVKGSPLNVRIGGAGDAALAKSMMSLLPKLKSKAPTNPFEEAQW